MIFNDYYHSMDRNYCMIRPSDVVPDKPNQPITFSGLGPQEIGTSTNPMMHQVQAFAAKIREGASKIEISFLGAGKSNSQQPSPEAFGKRDREDIKALAEINKIKTSVHAPLHGQSIAGMGREGFSSEARDQVLEEIERAIHFASDATKGGAIVFHTGEWMRPLSDIAKNKEGKPMFLGHAEEAKRAPLIVVDEKTGGIQAIRKDFDVYAPKFHTAASYEKEKGIKLVGTIDSKSGLRFEADDFVDINNGVIKKEWLTDTSKAERLFERVPVWNKDKNEFEVEKQDFAYFENLSKDLEKRKPGTHVNPEVLFFQTQIANQVFQAKGQALYYAQNYEQLREQRDTLVQAKKFYEQLEDSIPEAEKWKIMKQRNLLPQGLAEMGPSKSILPSKILQEQLDETTNRMRHIHESSAHADVQARQAIERMNGIKPIEEYGLEKTAWTIATAGVKAMEYSNKHKGEKDFEDIYVAPENFQVDQYGSHPEEIRRIIQESRKQMSAMLVQKGMSKEDANKEAKDHIKATIDIGHMNMWRKHMTPEKGESMEAREKRFEKWMLDQTEKLAKEGIIGHIHLTDNFGYNDEHLTPGQGNAPIKEFIQRMDKAGLKDFIAEAGSYNGSNVMSDTWALMGSPIYSINPPSFRSVGHQHFGYHNPAMYVVGAYAPSNEWRLWSEVPFE